MEKKYNNSIKKNRQNNQYSGINCKKNPLIKDLKKNVKNIITEYKTG